MVRQYPNRRHLIWILRKEKPGISSIGESSDLKIEVPLTNGGRAVRRWNQEEERDLKLEGRVRRETFKANILRKLS